MSRAKLGWLAAACLVLFAAGLWGWARWTLRDRVVSFASAVSDIGVERGMQAIPSEERVRERVRGLAGEHGLAVRELEVHIEPLDEGNADRADGVTQEVTRRMQEAVEGSEPGPGGPSMKMRGSLLEVRARVHGSKWFWSVDDEVEASRVLARRMEIAR